MTGDFCSGEFHDRYVLSVIIELFLLIYYVLVNTLVIQTLMYLCVKTTFVIRHCSSS